jgi:type II secretory pathway pseudopilin PulG
MSTGERARRGPRGFTYLGLLILVALLGLALAAAGEVVRTTAQREREDQLLWVGHQYRAAIAGYWLRHRAFPQALPELLGGAADGPAPVRFIRHLYPDPMTHAVDWVLVLAPGGGIQGVASSSTRAPLKTGHFDDADHDFEKAESYRDWQFTIQPPAQRRKAP